MQSLDILLGNTQYLIIKQYKQYLFDIKRPGKDELLHAFEYIMAEVINKMYTKMNRPNYKNNWIFSRPKRKLENVTKDNWRTALEELITLTLIPLSEILTPDIDIVSMSSDEDEHDIPETLPQTPWSAIKTGTFYENSNLSKESAFS